MKKGLNYLLVAFFVAAGLALAPVVSNAATLSFDPPVATVVPNSAFGMGVGASGDFNNDGNLDYVIARHRNFDPYTRVTLMLGNGDGTFSAGAEILTGSSDLYGLKVGDVNNDGNLDIVTVHNHARAVAVTLGNGDGTFATTVVMPVLPQGGRSVGLGDLNGDGYLDIIAGSSYNHTSVLLNNGDGTFGAPTNYGDPIFWGSTDIEVADLDGLGIRRRGGAWLPSGDDLAHECVLFVWRWVRGPGSLRRHCVTPPMERQEATSRWVRSWSVGEAASGRWRQVSC